MKVVTLWLLAPKKILADHHGEGVDAKKYVAAANTPANTSKNVEMASAGVSSAAVPRERALPHTAGHTSEVGLGGFLALLAAFGLQFKNRRRVA